MKDINNIKQETFENLSKSSKEYYEDGNLCIKNKKYKEAVENYHKSFLKDPTFFNAMIAKAFTLFKWIEHATESNLKEALYEDAINTCDQILYPNINKAVIFQDIIGMFFKLEKEAPNIKLGKFYNARAMEYSERRGNWEYDNKK